MRGRNLPEGECDDRRAPAIVHAGWCIAGALALSLASGGAVRADGAGNADVVDDIGCMQDVADFGLNCTANDVRVATATDIVVTDPCDFPGDMVTFSATFDVELSAQARHDVGIWYSVDGDPNGDGSISGTCTTATPAYAPDPPWLDLDGIDDPLPGDNKPSGIQDTCGDIDDDHNPLMPNVTLTVVCEPGPDGNLSLPYCTSWRQPGANDLCTSPEDAFPGSPSKCKCDPGFTVDIPVPGQIIVVKEVVDGSPSGQTFDFAVNGGPKEFSDTFTLTEGQTYETESNDVLAGEYSVVETVPTGWKDPVVSCVGDSGDVEDAAVIDLQAGEVVTCTFTNEIDTVAPETMVIKGNVDGDDNVATVDEPGDTVTIPVEISNASDDGTLKALTDDVYGDLLDTSNTNVSNNTCAELAGTTVTSSAPVSCSFDVAISEIGTITDTVTATLENVSGESSDSDQANTVVEDVLPTVTLDKSVTPDSLAEPGGEFTYTLKVTNTSVEPVTITALTDDNPLSTECTDLIGTALPVDGMASCTYVVEQTESGDYPNTATVTVEDDEENEAQASDDAAVTVTDELPAVDLQKTADPLTLPEPGGTFTYTLKVTNTSENETVTIGSLTDTNSPETDFGSCTALLGTTLTAGAMASCTYDVFRSNAGSYDNQAAVTVSDNEGNPASDTADATVSVTNAPPEIKIEKDVIDPIDGLLPEGGGNATYLITVTNLSGASDPVTITTLDDDMFGNLNGKGDCSVPQEIEGNGGTYSCQFTEFVNVPGGGLHMNFATATGTDDEGTPVEDDDDAEVIVLGNLCEPGKPATLTVQYDADNDTANSQAGSEVIIGDEINYGIEPVTITFFDATRKNRLRVIEEYENVMEGDLLPVEPGRNRFPPRLYIEVTNGAGDTQEIQFHTSCSQPLFAGDEFGPITLVTATH